MVLRFLCTLLLAFATILPVFGQAAGTENNVFSGTVTASTAEKVTVVRKVPAKADEYRDFVVDKDTKVEGKLHVSARVTVGFQSAEDGSFRALRIIVRTDAKAPAGRPSGKK